MCDLDQEFHYAEKTIEGNSDRLYLFSNENLEGVASAMDYFSENVLLVAGSGDGYFTSIYYGADTVDIFDIHPLTKPLIYLKIEAFKVLDYETFFIFFSPFIKERILISFLPKYYLN